MFSPYSMKEQLVSVRESSEEFLQESQKLREDLNQQTVLPDLDTMQYNSHEIVYVPCT